jgi:hypothetical protein
MSVGVMKDYKLKQRNLRASHTLGWSWNWNTSRLDSSNFQKKKFAYWDTSDSLV